DRRVFRNNRLVLVEVVIGQFGGGVDDLDHFLGNLWSLLEELQGQQRHAGIERIGDDFRHRVGDGPPGPAPPPRHGTRGVRPATEPTGSSESVASTLPPTTAGTCMPTARSTSVTSFSGSRPAARTMWREIVRH